eukprot:jgi/Chrzof1/6987/Cz02g06190.t1
MSRGAKELVVVLLDTGLHMQPYLSHVGKAVFNMVESKLLYKPAHEVALIYFGTPDTKNALNKEQEEEGAPGQYMNIRVQHPLQCVTLSYLKSLNDLPKGGGRSDYVNALLVALDLMIKAMGERDLARWPKRIVLISSFNYEIEALDDVVRQSLVDQLQQKQIKLDVFGVADTGAVANAHEDKASVAMRATNTSTVHELLAEVSGTYRALPDVPDMYGMFKAKEVSSTTMFKGPLTIGKHMEIQVRVFKKTVQEKLPSLKIFSDRSSLPEASHVVERSTEYRAPSDPDREVPPEERVKAYRYGKQNVPIAREDAELLEYNPEKGFQLLGFVEATAIPRYYYMKDSFIVLPEMDARAEAAMSALARALHNQKKVAIVRAVLRARSNPFIGVLTPHLATAPDRPDTLILNTLPFAEDMRGYFFKSFSKDQSKPELIPSVDQVHAAQRLVADLDMTNPRERLVPDATPNPVLQRFYSFLGQRALDPTYEVPEDDALVSAVFDAHTDTMSTAGQETVRLMSQMFKTEAPAPKAGADASTSAAATTAAAATATAGVFHIDESGARVVSGVGTATPVDDFTVMINAERIDDAMKGMQAVIPQLVDSSIQDRLYDKAVSCARALRAAAIQQRRPQDYNTLLMDTLLNKYKRDSAHGDFWMRLMSADDVAAPISNEECEGAGMSEAGAREFVRLHGAVADAGAPAAAADVAVDEEDEFAGME